MRKLKIVYIINFICLLIVLISNILEMVYKISKTNKYEIDTELLSNNENKENFSEINNLNMFLDFKKFEKNYLELRMLFLSFGFLSGGYIFIQQIIPKVNAIVCNLFYSGLNYVCMIFNFISFIFSLILILKINKIKKVDKDINNIMKGFQYKNKNWENYGNINKKCEFNLILNFIILIFCIIIIIFCIYGLVNIEYRFSDKGRNDDEDSVSDENNNK
jgi:hypothetical protein